MKFGKVCEEACVELEQKVKVPAFPYKRLKKALKKAEDAPDGRQAFAHALVAEVKVVDKAWKQAARSVIKSATAPRTSQALAKLGFQRQPVAAAPTLAEWALIARTGLRKIKKKYNKRLGARFGRLEQDFTVEQSFAFVASLERTEIQALASTVGDCKGERDGLEAGGQSDGEMSCEGGDCDVMQMAMPSETPNSQAGNMPRRRPSDSAQLECPVCLETLIDPVAPECGHAMCRSCFVGLVASKVTKRVQVPGGTLNLRPANAIPRCPLCREPATTAKPMKALARVCRAAENLR
mmetsp:Transcript_40019/g.105783  ORF Transcript_40019/g.105783 Transcript_40019/m.105783 type:complete len:294 (-) Transcript_40019:237-1118(-)|eukprot:CAMPEP_0115853072 /NCGR_PEP_ID=MMETSP0287-20121206/13318_1 /TAXON_ID=412157 /ORGANISM="Chrysochromulina rotalis, Strain UIO044" /LENGTH=293 /DNA_ID=CAMNT_0003307143 /DNA_START=45 /DNA_END=926 /DNA_ORIENTATION=+